MKLCNKCNLRPRRADYARECRECRNESTREWRARTGRNSDKKLIGQARRRRRARDYLRTYIKRGKITRQPCEVCGEIKSHAHHDDYTKPLEVKWLCAKHHAELHKRLRKIKETQRSFKCELPEN